MFKKISKFLIIAVLALNLGLFISVANSSNKLGNLTASASFCNDLEGEFAGFLDCNDQFTSFTDFEGGLDAPSAEGFDSSLTKATDARTYIKNIANFALGFLGLIAVMVIIYSGYLYVIDAGNEEQMNKGKAGIKSAIIGILIILSAFAIVNTILQAPGGNSSNIQQNGGVNGSGTTSQGNNAEQIANFNIAAEEIADLTRDYIKTYEQFASQQQKLSQLISYTPNDLTSRADFIDYLNKLKNELNNLANSSGSLSYTNLAAKQTINLLIDPSIQAINGQIKDENRQAFIETELDGSFVNFLEGVGKDLSTAWTEFTTWGHNGDNEDIDLSVMVRLYECSLPAGERGVNFDMTSCENLQNKGETSNLGTKIDTAFDNIIKKIIFEKGVRQDYDAKLLTYAKRIAILQTSLNTSSSESNEITNSIENILNTVLGNNSCTEYRETGTYGAYETTVITTFCLPDLPPEDGLTATISGSNLSSITKIDTSSTDFLDNYQDDTIPDNSIIGSDSANLTKIKNFILDLQDLYQQLKLVKFTNPIIDVNTFRGTSPLVVTFDASRSYNPAKITPTGDMYKWDINGDGEFASDETLDTISLENKGITCNDSATTTSGTTSLNTETSVRSSITCTFAIPGTYTVGLQLEPYNGEPPANKDSNIYAGIAYINIQVSPPASKINLTYKAGNTPDSSGFQVSIPDTPLVPDAPQITRTFPRDNTLRSYDANGRIDTDISTLPLALSEVSDTDVTFDASETKGNAPLSYQWIFQDSRGSNDIKGTSQSIIKAKYTERGNYRVDLAVIDAQGKIDRKGFTVIIQDLVARIRASAYQGTPGTTIEFSADGSVSDAGQISKYLWKVGSEEPEGNDKETFKYTFDAPGDYTVNLNITDSAGKTAETSLLINIESQPPQAAFSATHPKSNQPSLVVFNADQSFDPDPNTELTAKWKIYNATAGIDYQVLNEVDLKDTNTEEPLNILFLKKGIYKVELSVFDEQEKYSTVFQMVDINALTDISFAEDQVFASQLNDAYEADIDFKLESQFGEIATIDFGDGDKKTERLESGAITIPHTYTEAGAFEVVATVEKGDDQNTIKNTVVIGGGEDPIAVPSLKIDGINHSDLSNLPTAYRNTVITFDGSKSIDTNGGSDLDYQWDFGDGNDNTAKTATHTYQDLPPSDPGKFKISLTVTDRVKHTSDTQEFFLKVAEATPEAKSLLATALGSSTTPTQVKLEVIGAEDKDGRILKYRYYYFPVNNTGRQLGLIETDSPQTTLNVETFGLEDEEIEYAFCVDLTDDDGNITECKDLFDDGKLPTIIAINGPNLPPTANFTASKTFINVGETITFSAEASDPDGQIIEYTYDFDGDGSFVNNIPSESGTVSHTYHQRSTGDGFPVKLKVLDDKGATAQSSILNIRVDGTLDPPVAAFKTQSKNMGLVKFSNNSTADEEKDGTIEKYRWDFDLSDDSNGDGSTDNDNDSDEENPSWTYPENGTYQVKLIVEDSEGNQDDVIHQVKVESYPPVETPNDSHGSAENNNTNETNTADTTPSNEEDNAEEETNDQNNDDERVTLENNDSDSDSNSNQEDNPVDLNNTDLEKDLTLIYATPAVNQDTDEIYLHGNSGRIQLKFNEIDLDIDKIFVDSYIFFDKDGDGTRYNDIDFSTSNPNDIYESPIYTPGIETPNQLGISVTVIDTNGEIYFDFAKIIFEANTTTGAAALKLDLAHNVGIAFYISLLLFGLAFGASNLRHKDEHKKLL